MKNLIDVCKLKFEVLFKKSEMNNTCQIVYERKQNINAKDKKN